MKLDVVDTDTKVSNLTITGKQEVRIKLNRHWDDDVKLEVSGLLTDIASEFTKRNLGYTVRGKFDPKYPRIQLKSSNKKNPKVHNIQIPLDKMPVVKMG